MYFANELEKLHCFSIFICISPKNVVSLHPQFHAGDVCASSAGVADIFKRRLLTLCSGLVKCRSFELMFQDLATVDVLRGMKYPLVPFGMPFAYTCVRIRVP